MFSQASSLFWQKFPSRALIPTLPASITSVSNQHSNTSSWNPTHLDAWVSRKWNKTHPLFSLIRRDGDGEEAREKDERRRVWADGKMRDDLIRWGKRAGWSAEREIRWMRKWVLGGKIAFRTFLKISNNISPKSQNRLHVSGPRKKSLRHSVQRWYLGCNLIWF